MKKIFLFIICLGSIMCHAQNFTPFVFQNPEYGSHAINCTRWIAGQKFIAVGDAGAILLSNDDGASWQRIAPFTEQKFRSVFVKDSMQFFAVASHDYGLGEIYKTVDGGNTWTLIYANANMSLRDIHFPNDSIGYAVGYTGKVVKTTDYGNTWLDFTTLGSLSGNLTSVFFLNSDTGFVGRTNTTAAMYKTDNGGLTWSQVFGYLGQACYTIKFLNDTMGYAGAYNSRIFRTTNAGLTWTQQTTFQTNEEVTAIDFSGLTNGVAVTSAYVYRTSNGTTWSSPYLGGPNYLSCAMSPNGNLVLGDSYGGLRTAANFGTTYTNNNAFTGLFTYKRIKFFDAQNGWVMGEGNNILKTNNAGATWTNMNTSTYIDNPTDMAVLSANKVIICESYSAGKIYTTSNGGTTFTQQTLSATNGLNAISFPTSNVGYVVGDNGAAFKTTNGGTSYTAMSTGFTNKIIDVHFVTDQLGYILNEWGEMKKTVNGGSTWTLLNMGAAGSIKQIYFANALTGYTVNATGAVYKTTDGGISFLPAGQTCLETPFDMYFTNDSTGFVVGSFINASCDVSYTIDGGQTWNAIEFPFQYAGWGVFAFDTANVYLVGQSQTIIKTGSNGIVTATTNNKVSSQPEIVLYPNPTTGIVNIQQVYAEQTIVDIFDLNGSLVYHAIHAPASNQIDVSFLSMGLYTVRVVTGNASNNFKISKL
ncbi:MAG: YCF48-related protein [Bacteroidota bacterium]